MCGIAGFYSNGLFSPDLGSMLESISYRGPSSAGIYEHEGVSLGAVRLSIIDLDHGIQPMVHEPTGVAVSWNGEIFNYIEIRDQLRRKGHIFLTESDTEVLLRSYLEWGIECVNFFNGQFAISITDPQKKMLYLIRDRVGICPLFYKSTDFGLIFASEIKSILRSDGADSVSLNTSALGELFTFWTPIHDSTFIEGVNQILPGQVLEFNTKCHSISKQTYWEWPRKLPLGNGDFKSNIKGLNIALDKAIRLRLRSDVEVASYLSGGLDSSYLTCALRRIEPKKFHTFSIIFEDGQYNEKEFQNDVLSVGDDLHHEFLCKEESFSQQLEEVIGHTESPLFRVSPLPLFGLSKEVCDNNIRVVLTGEGADEIFYGYHILREARLRAILKKFPNNKRHRKLFSSLLQGNKSFQSGRFTDFIVDSYRSTLNTFSDKYFTHSHRWASNISNWAYVRKEIKSTWRLDDFMARLQLSLPADFSERSFLERGQLLDVVTLMQNYLLSSQGDRMLLGHSVEGRFPFLDHELIECAANLHEHEKLNGLHEKYIFKQLSRELVPEKIINRKKFPYETPEVRPFFCISGKESFLIEKYLSREAVDKYGIFDFDAIQLLLRKFRLLNSERFSARDSQAFIQILTTHIFMEKFIFNNKQDKEDSINFRRKILPPQIFKT